jgi:signal transduction histidine kinase
MCFGKKISALTHSLGARISLWYAIGFVGSFFLLIAFAFYLTTRSIHRSDRADVLAESEADAAHYRQIGEQAYRAEVSRELPDPGDLLLRLSAPDGQTLLLRSAGGEAEANIDWIESRLQTHRRSGWQRLRTRDHKAEWQVFSQRMPDGNWLQLAKNDAHARQLLRSLRDALFAAATLMVLLAIGGGTALTARALRPIRRLIETARKVIDSGDLSARVPLRGSAQGDELDELSRLFNQMLARNERAIQAMREALDNVAHELRTPLTRMRTGAEFALQRDGGNLAAHKEALADAIEESERVLSTLQSLMDIAEAEQGVMPLRLELLDLTALTGNAIDLYEPVAEEKSIHLTFDAPHPLWVKGDRVRLQQALANLLDNAIKYSPPDGQVRVHAAREGEGEARITVRDEGIGIGPEELPRIWDRLYRADKSRAGQRGLGLGLSFVKAIVEGHGGRVEAKCRGAFSGAEVGFLLPMARDAQK